MANNLLASFLGFDFNQIWWSICHGMYWIVNAIQSAFWYLAGIRSVNSGSADGYDIPDILAETVLSSQVQKAFLMFLVLGGFLCLLALAIGMIKASFQDNDSLQSRGKIAGKSVEAFIITLLMPIIFFAAVKMMGAFLTWIDGVMKIALGVEDEATIADIIHKVCFNISDTEFNRIDNAMSWDISFKTLSSTGYSDSYQYFMGIIASGILVFVLLLMCTSVVERIVEVVTLYIISPIILARTPLDDGGSFKIWKDLVIAKFLSVAGVLVSVYVYFMVLSKIGEWFDTSKITNASELVAINVAKVLLIIGGAFAAKKGSLLVAQLVSQSTGMSEGTSQGQSMGMLRGGLGIAKSALRAGGAGALLAMKGGAGASSAVGGVGNALASATGGTGRASIGGGAGGDAIGAAASGGSKLKSALSTAGNTAKGAATSVGNALATGGIFGLAGYGAAKLAKGAVKVGKGAAKLTGKAAKGAGNIAMKGADAVGLGGKLRYGATKTKLWGASVANKAKGLATSVKGKYDTAVGKYHANRLDKYSEQQNKLLANAENMWANVDKKDGKKYAGGVTDLQRSSTSSYDRKFDRLERKIKKGNDFINRQNNFNNNAGTTQPPTA